MVIEFSKELQKSEAWALNDIIQSKTLNQVHKQWRKWKIIRIISYVLSPLLVTIPLCILANRKISEANAQQHVILGMQNYHNKEWGKAIEHFELLSDAPLRERFKQCLNKILPSQLNNEDENALGGLVRTQAKREIKYQGMRLFTPSSAALGTMRLKCNKGKIERGDDNIYIIFGALIGCAYLHRAIDEIESSPQNKLSIKTNTVLAAQYLGHIRGNQANIYAQETFEKINQLLRAY